MPLSSNHMKLQYILMTAAAVIPGLVGCVSQPVALNTVGPAPLHHDSFGPEGYLKVFSDTETHVIGDGPAYYPHTGYNVYDPAGKRVIYVANHLGNMDETPMTVSMPSGQYNVVAESSSYGRVTVPVVIRPNRTTIIRLDRSGRPSKDGSTNSLVRLPNGEVVGYGGS